MKIVVKTSDCKVWQQQQIILDLIKASKIHDNICINLNSEGPCAKSLGLYALLDDICSKFAITPSRIIIYTCNQLETHDQYKIIRSAPIKGISELQKKLKQSPPKYKTIDKNTKHFGSFVGHGNRMRLAVSSYLYCKHKDKTLQSYHTDVKNAYFDQFIGLEELMFYDYDAEQVDTAFNFLKVTPLKLDEIVSYPILHEDKVYDILDYYPQIFVDIVNQTYMTGNTFYLDDKFWRSIITKTPFIVQGSQNFLLNLKRLGFKTFDCWWDEGYSQDPPDYQVKLIIENLQMISTWDTQKLLKVYEEMKPTLDHNYEIFMSLNQSAFNKVFNHG